MMILVLLVLNLTLSACTSTPIAAPPSATANAGRLAATAEPASTAANSSPTDPEKKEIDVLKIGMTSLPSVLDPNLSNANTVLRFVDNIYDTILGYDEDGNIICVLAESYKWVDDYTLEVKLKDGITFQNGYPLTAEDVKFTFDRIKTGVNGITPVQAGLFVNLESVEVVDKLTVRFKNAIVDTILLDRLANKYSTCVIPKKYVEEVGEEAFAAKPIGTGPFAIVSMAPEKIVLERYDGFWGEKPYVKRLEFLLFNEAASRYSALASGEIDIMQDVTTDLRTTIASTKGVHLVGVAVELFHFLVFKTTGEGPIGNPKFRQALACAIDRQSLVDALWGEYAYVPKGMQWDSFGDMLITDYEGMITYDVERAKRLLAESGYNGEQIELSIDPNYYTNSKDACEAIISMWAKIGVNAQLIPVSGWSLVNIKDCSMWSGASRFNNVAGHLGTNWTDKLTTVTQVLWVDQPQDYLDLITNVLPAQRDLQEQRATSKKILEIFDSYLPALPLYSIDECYGVRDGLHWNPYHGKQMSIPFRAEVFWAE